MLPLPTFDGTATGVEELGFTHLLAYDHVLGADPEVHAPWRGPYNVDTTFHEPFVIFGYLAACTRLELVTGVIILPQRQTALVAKQAAEVDLLTEGRFPAGRRHRMERGRVRGARANPSATADGACPSRSRCCAGCSTEQVVTHDGEFDRITGAGLAPLPLQRPIPIWVGGQSAPAYRRIGRLADGWFPQVRTGPAARRSARDRRPSRDRGRTGPGHLGMEGRVSWSSDGVAKVVDHIGRWRDAGATHVSINTMNAGLGPVDGHLEVLAQVAAASATT